MTYLGPAMVTIGTIVALRFRTWDNATLSAQKVTPIGWTALLLVIMGLGLSFESLEKAESDAKAMRFSLSTANKNTANDTATIALLNDELFAYRGLIEDIKAHSNQAMKMNFDKFIQLRPGQSWLASAPLNPSSRLEILFIRGSTLELNHNNAPISINRRDTNPYHFYFANPSQTINSWSIKNTGDDVFYGKVQIYAPPAGHSKKWSWLEKSLEKLPITKSYSK
ncbi:MAG: hypothetical protein VYA34_03965 [Myxococcota bacterium]|nr:hypothetical protein [Myxococcota bacterium]